MIMRQVITPNNIKQIQDALPVENKSEVKTDSNVSKIIKYIPAEVIAFWVSAEGIAKAAKDAIPYSVVVWVLFFIGILGTYLYLWRVAEVKDKIQLVISTSAFVIWVFALGGPFSSFAWYNPVYGALLLLIFTFMIPLMRK